jgi:hypothetical protein
MKKLYKKFDDFLTKDIHTKKIPIVPVIFATLMFGSAILISIFVYK